MFIPLEFSKYEIEVEKSKFIALTFPIKNVEEIKEIINKVKAEHSNARHILYAYKINNVTKSNDDNEPGNIAKGFIEIINKRNIDNILILVVRYFGGVKLGASRLLRTYINSVTECLNITPLGELKEIYQYMLETDYSNFNKIVNSGFKVSDVKYEDTISFNIFSSENIINELKKFIIIKLSSKKIIKVI